MPGRAPRLTARNSALLGSAIAGAAVLAERAGGLPAAQAAGDLAAGAALLVAAALTWTRHRRGSAGLMALAGAAWFAGDLSDALVYAHRGPLVLLLLTWPGARVRSRIVAAVVGLAYVDGLVPRLAAAAWPTIALMAALAGTAVLRHRTAAGVERRTRAVALGGAIIVAGALSAGAVARLAGAGAGADTVALWAYDVAVVITAAGLTAELLWGRGTRAAVTGLVVDLGDRHEPRALRAALARTLGDPGLEVAYRVAGADGWVDETGASVVLPASDGSGHVITLVHDAGDAVAALIHDPVALVDRDLAVSVAAAARLAVASARMQAGVGARVRELEDSRRRLLEAADDERRRLGEQLLTGVERRLELTSERLAALAGDRGGGAGAACRRLAAELDDARGDLHRFAQGIHPRALTKGGLAGALPELAAQAGVPVEVTVTARRLAPAREAAAFFVCSEGLANVAKHAGATRVEISAMVVDDRLLVRVADDGAGGADAACGSGLRGLADRVEALGGSLRVHSPPGAGTRLEADVPISEAGHA